MFTSYTIPEKAELKRLHDSVHGVVMKLEECSGCRKVTECEMAPYSGSFFCKYCMLEFSAKQEGER